jgi:hypothetical protein
MARSDSAAREVEENEEGDDEEEVAEDSPPSKVKGTIVARMPNPVSKV